MGVVFLLIVYALPSGVVGLWEKLKAWRPAASNVRGAQA
jgi:branched-chain amino acid transport system permease protein